MTELTLKFSNNWNNKLNCVYFTTLRLSNRFNIGHTVKVEFKEHSFYAEVVGKRTLTMKMLNEFICGIDTGYSVAETEDLLQRMYHEVSDWSNQPIYFYLLRRVKNECEGNPEHGS